MALRSRKEELKEGQEGHEGHERPGRTRKGPDKVHDRRQRTINDQGLEITSHHGMAGMNSHGVC